MYQEFDQNTQGAEDARSSLRTLMNRKREIESRMSDLQSEIGKIKREKEAIDLDVRAKKKGIQRLKVELESVELLNKKKDQQVFEREEEFKAFKKELSRLMVELNELRA